MQLAKREKYLIALMVAVVAVAVLFQLLVVPILEGRERMQSSVIGKQKNLQEIVRLSQEFKVLKQDSETLSQRLSRRPANFTLFSFLEKAAGKAGVKNNIKYMKPSASTGKGPFKESLVEMKLEKITLKQMVDYLKLIESPDDIVSLKRISIQTNKKETQYLDAILQVLTFSS
jgi:general secretion pathway protein M